MGNRRSTELLLLIAGAVPVFMLYALFVAQQGGSLELATFVVPIGLAAAFAAAHVAVRILAPGADPAILPIVFVLSGIGITFVSRLDPENAVKQVVWLFVSIAAMVATLAAVRSLDKLARYKYTLGLLGSMPSLKGEVPQRLASIPGTPPDLFDPPKGCGFASRCEQCMNVCVKCAPPEYTVEDGHTARCWLLDERCKARAEATIGRKEAE